MWERKITGQVFGRLTVLGFAGSSHNPYGTLWHCRCTCGNTVTVHRAYLKRGSTRSCGCLRIETTRKLKFSHGETHNRKESTELMTYKAAKQRCNNKKNVGYKNYGGRGIRFKFKSFSQFLKELGRRPRGKMLDRIDNNGHYEPGNVRWVTRLEQNRNKRPYARKSHCKNGHPFSPENTYVWHGDRTCKKCARVRQVEYRKR
jgi:hypothetical protein